MTTAEDFASIASASYLVDSLAQDPPVTEMCIFPPDDTGKQQFQVFDTATDRANGLPARGGGSREGRKTRVVGRLVLSAGIGAALAAALSGCAWGAKEVNRETNLANQRKAAIAFLETQGGVDEIRFTEEGGPAGFGAPWGVPAVVTIDGQEYNEILGTDRYSRIGNPLPTIAPDTAPAAVTVIYSDGASEVIE